MFSSLVETVNNKRTSLNLERNKGPALTEVAAQIVSLQIAGLLQRRGKMVEDAHSL